MSFETQAYGVAKSVIEKGGDRADAIRAVHDWACAEDACHGVDELNVLVTWAGAFNFVSRYFAAPSQIQMKMYILIKRWVKPKNAVVAAAHSSLAMYLQYRNHPNVWKWLEQPQGFIKILCSVSDEEFEQAKQSEYLHVVITESTLADQEVAIAFVPRETWAGPFEHYELYK